MTSGFPSPDDQRPRRALARRGILVGGAALALFGGARWFNVGAEVSDDALSVQDAHAAATSGAITLIDIRRPDEWARTGVGAGAVPLDMRREDFVAALREVAGTRPIALICARGVRSRGLSKRLTAAGFTNIIDVPEGMLGSGAGPGWIAAGLPVVRP
ncbi:rhodanese-like domain-containing protein [Sulfitobacter albidus]|uniref:Rhodanese-like domain-containing protein n=1 Tax=Sulfitobacter albidus TaxID=2829501 RepID=A0A975PN51_9RHOB|nr:rhodanese-like domain-containing protein [Sulfitobacter albidus]QUJ76925.1 rhodanese-like domain-containing protein [Sulfitobacter albidus]